MQNKRLPQLLPGFLLALLALFAGLLPASAQLGSFAQIGGNKVSSITNNGGGSYTIVGGGNDIWDQRDEFAFAYTEVTGDFDVRVRVDSLELGNNWTKAGLMARESLSEFSRMAFPRVTPDTGANDARYAYRTGLDNNAGVNGGQHEDCTDCEAQRPGNGHRWLRLVRTGSVFDAYSSPDGSAWTSLGSQNSSGWGGGNMANTLYIGLAVSRNGGPATVTAQFSNFSFNYGASFSVAGASSRGNPNGIEVTFTKPPGASALTAANYSVSGGVTITSVSPGSTLNSVRLNTSGLTEGTSYTVTVAGVQAADSTALSAPTTATFTHGAGYEARSIRISHNKTDDGGYYRGSDAVLKGIGDVVRMANGNTFAAYQSNSVFEDPIPDDGGHERFSSTIAGVFVPPTSGNYTFYCSSDDVGYLFLSTDDLPANRVQIATEPQWNGVREYVNGSNQGSRGSPASNISAPQALVAGRKYYIEYAYTEGGGGNNGSVAVLTPGGAPVVNGSSPIPASLFTPAREWNGEIYYTLGVVSMMTQPASTTVQSPNPATFSVRADGTPGYAYQWQRRGSGDASFADVPGATGSSYTLASTSPSDNQAQYRCVVRNEFSEVNSAAALLTVLTDTTPPTLISAINVPGSSTSFDLTFSEPVDPNDAVDLLNYTASSGITLSSATIQPGNRVVRFTCSSLVTLACTTLSVSNVRDASNQGNPIAPNSTIGITYAAGGVLVHRFDGIGGVSPADLINNAAFPNSPSVVTMVNQFEYIPNVDNYGARLMAFVSPPVTGPYTFYVAADDGASLWLSTDVNPANKVLIANEPVWANSRQWTGQAGGGGRSCPSPTSCNISPAVTLQSGCKYYIEMIFKEGGGGDNGAVAWRTPATGPSPNVPANGSAPIPGTFLSPFMVPATVVGDIANQTVPCGGRVTFNASIIGTPPLVLQWYENGVAIPGATGSSYTTRPLTEADSGVKYYLEGVTTDPAGTARTTEAVVTVVPDPTPLLLLSASCNSTFDGITLSFNKSVDPLSAADTISYVVSQVGGGALGISGATVLADGKTILLGTTAQTPDTLYEVTVTSDLYDFCFTPFMGTNVTIRSLVISCGTLVFETYPTGGGTAVSILTGHPTFPNNPDSRMNLNSFDTRAELGTDNYRDNYGGRVRGIYFPPASGNYQFFIHSDDASQLFLNPTGPGAAGKVLIAEETGCCRDWPAVSSSTFFPAGIPLVANQPYYIEGLFKEGGGGDYIRVAARLVGSSEPLVAIGSNQLGRVSPAGALGTVSITQQPASRTVQEGDLATFSVTATTGNSVATCYQWRRNGTDIPGATTPSLSIGPVGAGDNGAVFSCFISMPGSSATSQDATLTVVPRTGGLSCGFLVFESYECGGGTAVSRLTGSPLFPGSPRERLYMTSFDTRTVYPNDSKDNYGARIRGYFIPPTSGNWILYLRSDDSSQLFLSPSMDPSAKVLLTEETGCCAGFGAHASSPIPLVGGQAYYIEALYKEGGGGDYCQVAAKLENDPTIPDTLRPIPGAWLAAVVDSEGSSLAISSQPQSTKTCLSLGGANPETVVNENFGSGNGGGTVTDFNGPFEGPWTYNGTRGTWTSAGQGPDLGRAPSTRLTFGPYSVTKSGNARLSFEHRYSFEGDTWDGGQVRVSVNGGPFVAVPSAAFVSGGYNGTVNSSSASELNSQPSYVETSPNYGGDQFITSVADLGVFLAGDNIRVQFVAAFDTNTRQGDPAWEVTSLGLTAGIGGAAVASFSVGVTATGPGGSANPPVYIQWQRNCGADWVNIPGAGSSTYTFSPRLADNGCRFRAIVCIPGGSTMSSEATLAVVQPNTPPSFVAPATFQSYEDAAMVVSGFLSNLQPDSIDATEGSFSANFTGTPTPVIFTGSSFDSLPPGAAMIGSAYIGGGRLHLTDALNSQFGALLTGFDPNPRDAYTVSWTEYVGGGTCCGGNGADGYSLNIASDLQLSGFAAEEGTGSGVSLLFDTWDNGGGEAPAINLKWQGNILASAPIDVSQDNAAPTFRPVSFSVTAAGQATLSYNGNVVFNNVTLPGWAPQSNLRILLGARTGGANDNHHIDDMALTGLAPVLNVPPPPPAGSVVYGSAYLGDGVLHITDAINGASGAFVVDDLLGGAPLGRFTMNFDVRVGGGTAPPADGFAVSIANNLPAGTWPIAEEGEGNGLSVCFDIFDNGGGEAPAIDIKWQGNTIAHTSVPSLETGDQFVPVSIKLDPDGTLDLIVAGAPVYTDLPTGYVPINGARFGIGGRTGGLNANQWVDNLNIQASAVNPGDAEASQTITVTVNNDNPALFSVQPAIGSDGTLTYTPVANACGSAKLTIVAKDNGGTDPDCGGRDTTEPFEVTLTIAAVNDCPVPAPLAASVPEGGSTPIVLSATDADANGCGSPLSGFIILTQPAHGTLSGTPPNLVYTPAPDYPNVCGHNNGADAFTYAATDGQCTSGPVAVTITVVEVNDCPVARIANGLVCELAGAPQNFTFIVSPNGSNATVILDGSQSSDVECDAITYAWYLNGSVVPFSTAVASTNLLPIGQHSIQLVVDDGQCVGMATLQLEIISPGDAVDLVIEEINNSTLARREQRPLIASLKAASASFERDSLISGINQLSAFLNKVRAQIAPDYPVEAARLTLQVQSIINAVRCSEELQNHPGKGGR